MSWDLNLSLENQEFLNDLNTYAFFNSFGNSSYSFSPRFPWQPIERENEGREEEKELLTSPAHHSNPQTPSPPKITAKLPTSSDIVRPQERRLDLAENYRIPMEQQGAREENTSSDWALLKQIQSCLPRSTPFPTRTGYESGGGSFLTQPESAEKGHQNPPEDPQRFSPIQQFQYPSRGGQGPPKAGENNRPIHHEGDDYEQRGAGQSSLDFISRSSSELAAPRHSPRYENIEPKIWRRQDSEFPRCEGHFEKQDSESPRRESHYEKQDSESPRRESHYEKQDSESPRREGHFEKQDSESPRREGHFEKLYWEEREARERLEEKYARRPKLTETEIIERTYQEMQYVLRKKDLTLFGRYESLIQIIRDPDFKSFVKSSRFVDHHYEKDKIKKIVEGHPKFEDALVDIIREVRHNFRTLRSPRMFALRINNIINDAMTERRRRS